jgi:hypothetical protein
MSVTVTLPAALEVTAEFSNSSIAVEVDIATPLEVAVTIGNVGDMQKATYDPDNGARQVAFKDQLGKSLGVAGFDIFMDTTASDIEGYDTLNKNFESVETEVTIVATNETVWGEKYLCNLPLGITEIPAGVWGFNYTRKVSATSPNKTSKKLLRVFRYTTDGEEIELFQLESPDILETSYQNRQISYAQEAFACNATDRIGVQSGFSTTRASATTLTYIVGDGRGWFMRTPLVMVHNDWTGRDAADAHPMESITPPTTSLATEPADANYFAIFTTVWKRFTWLTLKTWLLSVFKTYCGFENRTDSEFTAVDDGGWQFTIAPKSPATSYHVWSGSVKRTISNSLTIAVGSDLVLYYIYFDTDGSLVASTSIWDFESENAPIAIFYRDGTSYALTDERHSYARNRVQHGLDHNTIGARFKSGFTGSFLNDSFSVIQGVIYDEDIKFDSLTTKTTCSIWHRATTLDRMRLIRSSATVYPTVGGQLAYDLNGTLTPLGANQYGVYWVYATNDPLEPIYAVASQAAYTNVTNARNAASPTIYLSTAEWKLLYRVIYRNTSPITYIEAADFRTVQTGTPITATTQDHSALINRDAANSHPASASTIDDPFTPSNAVVLAGDTALVGFQKLQGQINLLGATKIIDFDVTTGIDGAYVEFDNLGINEGETLIVVQRKEAGSNGAAATNIVTFNDNTNANIIQSAGTTPQVYFAGAPLSVRQLGVTYYHVLNSNIIQEHFPWVRSSDETWTAITRGTNYGYSFGGAYTAISKISIRASINTNIQLWKRKF